MSEFHKKPVKQGYGGGLSVCTCNSNQLEPAGGIIIKGRSQVTQGIGGILDPDNTCSFADSIPASARKLRLLILLPGRQEYNHGHPSLYP